MTAPLVHLDQVSHSSGTTVALHPLDLTIRAGSRHAIIGSVSGGASTLLRMTAGQAHLHTGRIVFAGDDITRLDTTERSRRGIGFSTATLTIIEELSVSDNVGQAVRRHVRQIEHQEASRRARRGRRPMPTTAALELAGLTADSETLGGDLSFGQRQRLKLAIMLATRPRLLLLDEPSAGLDPAEIRQLAAVIHRLGPEITLLMAERHLPLVWDVADTVTVLAAGHHVATGPPSAFRDALRSGAMPAAAAL